MKNTKNRRKILQMETAILLMVSMLMTGCKTAETEENTINTESTSTESTTEPNAIPSSEVEDTAITAENVVSWLKENSQKEGITAEDREHWKEAGITQQVTDLLNQWAETLIRAEIPNMYDYSNANYSFLCQSLQECNAQCKAVFMDELFTPHLEVLTRIQNNLATLEDIRLTYGDDPAGAVVNSCAASFFVHSRLDESYSENVTVSLEAGHYDGYVPNIFSDWITANVVEEDGQLFYGQNRYIVRAAGENPFNQQGFYNLYYQPTGLTSTIRDENGFEIEVPIFILTANQDTVDSILAQQDELQEDCLGCTLALEYFLNPSRFDNMMQREKAEILEVEGDYFDGISTWRYFSLDDHFPNSKIASKARPFTLIGSFSGGYNMPDGDVYLLGDNLYLWFCPIHGGTAVLLSLYKDGNTIMMEKMGPQFGTEFGEHWKKAMYH